MSTVPSKMKKKRSRSSSSKMNNSFVKNVTSKVSGFLPAAIAKWFNSPNSSNTNGSAPTADATDSSTEDEGPENPPQPPIKRMRYSSPGKYNHFAPTDPNCVPSHIEPNIEQITPYSAIQTSPSRSAFRRETSYVPTPVRAPNEETVIERSERDSTMQKSQHSVSNKGPSIDIKRKSLFDSSPNREASMQALRTTANNTVVDPKAPCFKPSLLGSPFYPGRTMYGGASMYINHPNIKQRKVTLVNESNSSDNTTMSHSARRVMDLLENYSSPVIEAKRISQFVKNSWNDSKRNDTLDSTQSSSAPYTTRPLSYKTQELHVPNIATILRLKQRSRLMDTTNAARQIIASHSSTMPEYLQPYPASNTNKETEKDTSNKLTTKVKTKLTGRNRGDNIALQEKLIPVNLPIDKAGLQIDKDNLPKFNFGNLTQTNLSSSKSKPIPKHTITSTTITSPVTEAQSGVKNVDAAPSTSKHTEKLVLPKSKDWQCPDCWVNNKIDVQSCVCCGAKQPSKDLPKPPKCSNCMFGDRQPNSTKCITCSTVPANNNNTKFPVLKPQDSSKWKCDDCWVSNETNVDKCVCCGAKNQITKAASASSPAKEWKCDDCWINNKANVNKCAACGAAKPGTKPTTVPVVPANEQGSFMFGSQDTSMKNLVKSQNDKWECYSCLVRNENNRTKCACCQADKPGSVSEPEKNSFNFGMTPNTTFKFGIDSKAQECSSLKSPEVKPSESTFSKPEESETNNNILPKTPSFTFGIPAKKADDQIDAAKEDKITETPKIGGFSFIPLAPTKSETAAPSIFGSSSKFTDSVLETNVEKEKPQVVPKVDFKLSPKPIATFGTSLNSQEPKEKIVGSSAILNQLTSTDNKEVNVNVNVMVQPSAISNESGRPASTFTFSKIGDSSNLFGATAAPASTAGAFTMQSAPATTEAALPLFQKPEATGAPMLSIFSKPNPPTTSTISLFQKNETITTTAAPASLGSTAPIFSFGSNNAQSAAPQTFGGNSIQNATSQTFGGNVQNAAPPAAEKPKFNFTFGGNTSLFNNSTFNASTDNNANTNKFGITTNNLSGNGMSTVNPLAGGNGLSPSKLGGEMNASPLNTGNEMASTPNLFGAPTQKKNLWSPTNNNSTNMFVTSAATNPMQKPAAFTFGSATPFNASNNSPAFGSNPTPPQNMFGMNQSTNAQPTMFASSVQNQSTPNVFGMPQQANVPAPAMNMFGAPSVGATPAFGAPNQSIPSFDAPHNPAPAPAFNFGAPQTSGVFGFGQQQQPQQPQQPQMAQQAGVYSFGATSGAPQVQFNMGSAPSIGVRRVRKAVRRNTQR